MLCRYSRTGSTAVPLCRYRVHCYSCTGRLLCRCPLEGPLLCRYSCTGRLLCRCACIGLAAIPVQNDCCAAVPVQDPRLFLYRTTAVPLFLHIPVQGDCRYSCTGPTVIPAVPLFLYRAQSCAAIPIQDPLLCRYSCTGPTAVPLFLYRAIAVPLFPYRTPCCAAVPVQGRQLCRYSHTGPTAVPLFLYRAHCCAAIPVQGPLLCRYSCTGPTAVPLFPYRAQDKHRQKQRWPELRGWSWGGGGIKLDVAWPQ